MSPGKRLWPGKRAWRLRSSPWGRAVLVLWLLFGGTILAIEYDSAYLKGRKLLRQARPYAALVYLLEALTLQPQDHATRRLVAFINIKNDSYHEAYRQVEIMQREGGSPQVAAILYKQIFHGAYTKYNYDFFRNFLYYTCGNALGGGSCQSTKYVQGLLADPLKVLDQGFVTKKGRLMMVFVANTYQDYAAAQALLARYRNYQDRYEQSCATEALELLEQEEQHRTGLWQK